MPKPIVFESADEATDHLRNILTTDPEVRQWLDDGYHYAVTIVEVDDMVPDSALDGESAKRTWMHDCHVALAQFSSATQLGSGQTVFCWRYGENKIMSIDFKKDESELGRYLQRFINRRTIEAEVAKYIGEPTVSVGVSKSTEFGNNDRSNLSAMADNLVGRAQGKVRECKEAGKNNLRGVDVSYA